MGANLVVRAELIALTDTFRSEIRAVQAENARMVRSLGRTNQHLGRFQDRLNRAGRSARAFAGAFIGFGIVNSVQSLGREFVTTANAMQQMQGRIQLVTRELGNSVEVSNELFRISQRTRTANETIANSFSRLAVAVGLTRDNYRDLLQVTEALSLTGAISGTGLQERQAVLTQVIQALASGELRGEELRSVREQDPRLTRLLTQIAEQNNSTLKAFAEQGRFTRELLVRELVAELQVLQKEFRLLPATVSQVFSRIRNQVNLAVVDLDAFFGVNQRILGVLREIETRLTPDNYVRFAIAIEHIRQNVLALINPIRVLLNWLNAFTTGINALELALYALPFLGLVRVITGSAGAVTRGFQLVRGQRRTLEKAREDIRLFQRENRRPILQRGEDRDAFNDRVSQYDTELSRLKEIENSARQARDEVERFISLGGQVDRVAGGLFLGSVGGYGLVQGARGINPLTEGLEDIQRRQEALTSLLPAINAHLAKRGEIYDDLAGKIRKFTEAERLAFERGEILRRMTDYNDRLAKFREEFALTYEAMIGLLRREASIQNELADVEGKLEAKERERRTAGQADRSRLAGEARELRRQLSELKASLSAVIAEQQKVLASPEFKSASLQAFEKLEEQAKQFGIRLRSVSGAVQDVTDKIETLDLRSRQLFRTPSRLHLLDLTQPGFFTNAQRGFLGPFQFSARRQFLNAIQSVAGDEEAWKRYRETIGTNLRERFLQAQRDAGINVEPDADFLRRLSDFNARRAGRETGSEIAERLQLERMDERREVVRSRLNELAARHNRLLAVTGNILTTVHTQIQGIVAGTTSWQEGLRNVVLQLSRLIAQYGVIEPLARRIAGGFDPQGAQAVTNLRNLSQGLLFNLVSPGGRTTVGEGLLTPGQSSINNSGNNTSITYNVVGTPGSIEMFRRGNSQFMTNVFRLIAENVPQTR